MLLLAIHTWYEQFSKWENKKSSFSKLWTGFTIFKKQKNNNNICCVVDNFTHFLTNSCSCSDVFCNLEASVSFLAYDCPSIVPCFCLDGFLISLSLSFDYLTYLSFMVLHPAGVLWSRLIYWINGMCIHFSLLWLSSRAPNFILFFPPFPIVASDNFHLIRTLW